MSAESTGPVPRVVTWTGVRTDADPVRLVLAHLGGGATTGRVRCVEAEDVVQLELTLVRRGTGPVRGPGRRCTVDVELERPLADRPLRDPASGRTHHAFDGSRLARPGGVDGWTLVGEGPEHDPPTRRRPTRWSLVWRTDHGVLWVLQGTSSFVVDRAHVHLLATPTDLLGPGAELLGRGGGHTATACWNLGGTHLTLTGGTSEDELLAVAASVR